MLSPRWTALVVSLGLSAFARAEVSPYLLPTVPGTRSIAMGGAFRAVGSSNDAIILDPAALAMSPHYEVDGFFGYAFAAPATYWNASIVDSSTLPLAVGVDYTHLASGVSPDRFSGSNLRVALGYPLTDQIFIGVTGNWLDFSPSPGSAAPAGSTVESVPVLHANSITGDAAIVYRPVELLSIAAVGYNLINVDNPYLAPLGVALAAAFGSDTSFRVAADGVANLAPQILGEPLSTSPSFDFHLGGEYLIAQMVAVRAGYHYDGLFHENFLSAGAAVLTPYLGFDVSYQQQIGQWNDTALILGVKIFLPT